MYEHFSVSGHWKHRQAAEPALVCFSQEPISHFSERFSWVCFRGKPERMELSDFILRKHLFICSGVRTTVTKFVLNDIYLFSSLKTYQIGIKEKKLVIWWFPLADDQTKHKNLWDFNSLYVIYAANRFHFSSVRNLVREISPKNEWHR